MERQIIDILKTVEEKISGLENRLDRTEAKVDKNTMLLEDFTKKFKL